MVAGKPGSENGFCVPAPLSSGNCPNDDNLPIFKHVDQHVDSHDALQQILNTYDLYEDMLRVDAQKHVVVISDDDATNITAQSFDASLLALDAPMFEDYVFHGIVSEEDDPGGFDCAFNPVPCCDVSADEGKVYKQLINLTQGVFGDLCQQNFQPVWDVVSEQVINNATIACEWEIPAPPEGEQFTPDQVNVDYTADGNSGQLGKVASASDCSQVVNGWYYDNLSNPTKILVCPQTCSLLQAADDAEINIQFGCATIPATPN